MAKFKTPDGAGDEKQAMTLVGGHLMLRLLNPSLIAAEDDPTLTEDQKKTITMQTKLLQSISNNAVPNSDKMAVFSDLVATQDGRPSPDVLKLQAFMKNAVETGKLVDFEWTKAGPILNNDRARARC